MKRLICISFVLMSSLFAKSQLVKYSPTKIDSLLKSGERMTVVFISADWCKFCELMKNSTFKNDELISLLNNNYSFIELEEQFKTDIIYKSRIYEFLGQNALNGKHELAIELAKINGVYALPGLCIFDRMSQKVFQHSGFLSADEMIKLLLSLK